jgi:hypothetical protein
MEEDGELTPVLVNTDWTYGSIGIALIETTEVVSNEIVLKIDKKKESN